MDTGSFGSIPFIPGISPTQPELLARYLPPIPEQVISTWLQAHIPPGSWILDPFGASPRLAQEAARAGYRVLVAANNPIARFVLEMSANSLEAGELKAALAELAASYIGDERVEPHIRELYSTTCARCGQTISAEAFLWEVGTTSPYARLYTCPFCGDTGEHPATTFDAEFSSRFVSSGLHRARALERVVAFNDPDRVHVEQAISVYSPRALDALLTIVNKLQGLKISAAGLKYLQALLLFSFDQSNSMWRPQAMGDRRRQLTIPRHYRENNVWTALEEGIKKWTTSSAENPAVAVTIWPDLPPQAPGICVYEGRLVNLINSLKDIDIKSVCAAIPRPNQAYWTLCALWAGWLWGREAVGTFRSVLHRQRYDWAWHANALASVFKQLVSYLPAPTPIFGLIGEAEPGFIGSALTAAGVAGCHLENLSLRSEEKLAQITWMTEKNHEIDQVGAGLTQSAIQSARRYLELNGEPQDYLPTISAAMLGIIDHWQSESIRQAEAAAASVEPSGGSPQSASQNEPTPSVIYTNAYSSAREALTYRAGFLRYNLQDEKLQATSARNMAIQSTLFSTNIGRIDEEDEESAAAEPQSIDGEPTSEKEQPIRSSEVSESTVLWLREIGVINRTTSTDKYERFLVNYLSNSPSSSYLAIDQAICSAFPGLFTPDSVIPHLILDSYALPDPHDSDHWYLRPEDQPIERQADVHSIQAVIHQIGDRIGFECLEKRTSLGMSFILWQDPKTSEQYWLFTTPSAAIGEIVLHGDQPPGRGIIVFPASRANLLIYKLRRDPRLNRAFHPTQGAWQFLKFRHLRSLSDSTLLNRDNLDQMLRLDPITFSTPQLWLV